MVSRAPALSCALRKRRWFFPKHLTGEKSTTITRGRHKSSIRDKAEDALPKRKDDRYEQQRKGEDRVDFTLGLGNPNSDPGAAVSPAWMHLKRLYCNKSRWQQ